MPDPESVVKTNRPCGNQSRGLSAIVHMPMARIANIILTVALLGVAAFLGSLPFRSLHGQSTAPELKLLISTDQHTIAQPYPARLTLQMHNASQQTIWLYHRASAVRPPVQHVYQEGQPAETTGGSTLEVNIQPAEAKAAQAAASPAQGMPFEYIGLPSPKLVKVAPGGDYEERAVLHLTPAMAEGLTPLWGVYRLTVTYGAQFSTAADIQHDLGLLLWQGKVTSNALEFELQPAPADAVGAISGSAVGRNTQPTSDVRVSLTDEHDHLIDQQVTGAGGSYSFEHLPLGLYWITGRREAATEDTAVFHSVQLTADGPRVADRIDLTPPGNLRAPRRCNTSPCLFKIVDAGAPAPRLARSRPGPMDRCWTM